MSVAPIYGDETTDVTLTDPQYAAALEVQRLSRGRRLRLVTTDPGDEPIEVAVCSLMQAQQSELMARLALRLLETVLRTTVGRREVQHILAGAWPWAAHLPEREAITMVDELGEFLLSHPASDERDDAALQLLIEWEHTAEIYANPELQERLRGPVPLDGPAVAVPGDEAGSGQ